MNLHLDRDAFQALLSTIGQRTGIREDIIEKDYYLTMLLYELSQKQPHLPAYFKGGTALYKALGEMIRFSEDIDLTVEVKDCTTSQGKKRLETAANGYRSLPRTKDKFREGNHKGSITSVYEYEPLVTVDTQDVLQRFGYVKVEATSFTISEPYESMTVAPLLYEKATGEEQQILTDRFEVQPFPVNTIRLERIFADKILAAEFYYQRALYFDVAKHLFDLTQMMGLPKIKNLLDCPDMLVQMLSYKRAEERLRIGSDLAEKPFDQFTLFNALSTDVRLKQEFMKMQEIYVFDPAHMLGYQYVVSCMEDLYQKLLTLNEGFNLAQNEDITLSM